MVVELSLGGQELRVERYGPGDFDLVASDDMPPIGDSIDKQWRNDPVYYGESMGDEELLFKLEYFLRYRMCNVFTLYLQPTGKYSGVHVKWVPGHVVKDKYNYGPMHADIMVIGNVPSEPEIEKGRLWRGPAARLTETEFKRVGLDFQSCYGTYVNKFAFPYPNMKTLPAAWVREGSFFLHQEIRLVAPKYLLLLGADALKAVFGRKATIKAYKGTVHEYCGAKVVVTNNPSDLVRNPEKIDVFRQDLARFSTLIAGGRVEPSNVNYHYLRTEEELAAAVEECMGDKVFAMDCEWFGEDHIDGHLLTIQFSRRANEAYVVILRSDVNNTEFQPSQSAAISLLRKLLCRDDVGIVGHNFRADLKFLKEVGLDLSNQFAYNGFDTMLAHHLIEESAEHNLTACALADTDLGRYDLEVEAWISKGYIHGTMPEEVLLPYAAADADVTYRLYEVYKKRLWDLHTTAAEKAGVDPWGASVHPDSYEARKEGWLASQWNLLKHVVMPANSAISEMEMEGMLADPERLKLMAEMFAQKRRYILEELRSVIHEPDFNPRSSKQVARLLFGKPGSECADGVVHTQLGLTPIKTTGKRAKLWDACERDEEVYYLEEPEYGERGGKEVMVKEAGWNSDFHAPSTDSESLAVLAEDYGCHEADLLRSYRFIDQICKNFLVLPETVNGDEVYTSGLGSFIKRDGRIRTNISQLTETGRYRSSKPNLQNLPKGREGDLGKIFQKNERAPPIRSVFVASPGRVLIEADFKSAESFTLAYISDDDAMKADLSATDPETGKELSVHSVTAVKIFKLNMTVPEFEVARKKDPYLGGLRIAAKSVNFG